MGQQDLPKNYHRDWQRRRAAKDPDWYESRKLNRTIKRQEHKTYWVKQFGGRCKDCRGKFPADVYDFHHPKSESKEKFSNRATNNVFMRSKENAAKELRKCVMLCANCHRIRHWKARCGR